MTHLVWIFIHLSEGSRSYVPADCDGHIHLHSKYLSLHMKSERANCNLSGDYVPVVIRIWICFVHFVYCEIGNSVTLWQLTTWRRCIVIMRAHAITDCHTRRHHTHTHTGLVNSRGTSASHVCRPHYLGDVCFTSSRARLGAGLLGDFCE